MYVLQMVMKALELRSSTKTDLTTKKKKKQTIETVYKKN